MTDEGGTFFNFSVKQRFVIGPDSDVFARHACNGMTMFLSFLLFYFIFFLFLISTISTHLLSFVYPSPSFFLHLLYVCFRIFGKQKIDGRRIDKNFNYLPTFPHREPVLMEERERERVLSARKGYLIFKLHVAERKRPPFEKFGKVGQPPSQPKLSWKPLLHGSTFAWDFISQDNEQFYKYTPDRGHDVGWKTENGQSLVVVEFRRREC